MPFPNDMNLTVRDRNSPTGVPGVTTDPPAGTPPQRVLLHASVGDWQVTTYAPRMTPAARRQKARFLLTGEVVDVCGGQPCRASGATSP